MKRNTVHYTARFCGESSILITGARQLVQVVPGLYIARISTPDEYRPEYCVELVSVEPGPALPYYGQLDHIPACHSAEVAEFMEDWGGK